MSRRRIPRVRKRWTLPIIGLLVLAGISWYVWSLTQPVGGSGWRVFRAPKGANARQIGRLLQEQRLVRSARQFEWTARLHGSAHLLKPGIYELSPAMSPQEIVRILVAGETSKNRLTIPEGFSLDQIAETVDQSEIADREVFLQLVQTGGRRFHAPFPLPDRLEGYLFAGTYYLPAGSGAHALIQTMIDATVERIWKPLQADLSASEWNLHEVLTIASMIEREARIPADRPLISAVIHNRIRAGMPLQIDATVLYALGEHKQTVRFSDLKLDSPYNTYRVKGLPPGPIASPGVPSVQAALRPARVSYLYYVAKPDGSHVFTNTLAEHNRAIRQIRKTR